MGLLFQGYGSSISLCFPIYIHFFFPISLLLSLSWAFFSLLLSLSTGKVFSGQKLIKIGGKDVVGLDNSDIAVLILGAPGGSSKYMYLCMHVYMGGVVCMFVHVCVSMCECVSRGFQKNQHQCYVSMWLYSIAALVAWEL